MTCPSSAIGVDVFIETTEVGKLSFSDVKVYGKVCDAANSYDKVYGNKCEHSGRF